MKKTIITMLTFCIILLSGCSQELNSIEDFHPIENKTTQSKEEIIEVLNTILMKEPEQSSYVLKDTMTYSDFEPFKDSYVAHIYHPFYFIFNILNSIEENTSFEEAVPFEIESTYGSKVTVIYEDNQLKIEQLIYNLIDFNEVRHHILYIDLSKEGLSYESVVYNYGVQNNSLLSLYYINYTEGEEYTNISLNYNINDYSYTYENYKTLEYIYTSKTRTEYKNPDTDILYSYSTVDEQRLTKLVFYNDMSKKLSVDYSSGYTIFYWYIMEIAGWNNLQVIDTTLYSIMKDDVEVCRYKVELLMQSDILSTYPTFDISYNEDSPLNEESFSLQDCELTFDVTYQEYQTALNDGVNITNNKLQELELDGTEGEIFRQLETLFGYNQSTSDIKEIIERLNIK